MAVVGAQFANRADADNSPALSTLAKFLSSSSSTDDTVRPFFSELAAVADSRGFYNVTFLAYWPSRAAYEDWATKSGFQKWWDDLDPQAQPHGWFREVFFPTLDRFETVFSSAEIPEGAAYMRQTVSGPVQEHVYWGSMRDRLPAAQTDNLVGEKADLSGRVKVSGATDNTAVDGVGPHERVRVPGKKNLAIIRSGQDWQVTYPEERTLYLGTMHPVLIKGMDFLRDHGDEVGCYSCRFMDIVDPVTRAADKDRTFGLAYFDDLASLERWSKEHPTHLNIFGGFLQYAKALDNNITLRLFHEVLVLQPEQQLLEYICCHDGTGMLVSVKH